jgi:hypothetical protein
MECEKSGRGLILRTIRHHRGRTAKSNDKSHLGESGVLGETGGVYLPDKNQLFWCSIQLVLEDRPGAHLHPELPSQYFYLELRKVK